MRKSGVKGLGRLLSVLMVAALLMTTAMVPALALARVLAPARRAVLLPRARSR